MRKTPNSHKDTTPFILDNPVGVDTIVKVLQADLLTLPWIEKSFNRATIMSNIDENQVNQIYPVCFVGDNKDEFPMIGNDNWSAYSFFATQEDEAFVDYSQFDTNEMTRELSLYVWINLDKTQEIEAFGYPENLKQQVELLLKTAIFDNNDYIEITNIVDNPLDIYDGFTVDPTKTQLLYAPYKGYRFDINCAYTDKQNCNDFIAS